MIICASKDAPEDERVLAAKEYTGSLRAVGEPSWDWATEIGNCEVYCFRYLHPDRIQNASQNCCMNAV
ncbi:hypothetical protein ACULNC_11430 [Shigella flexneri]